MLDFLHKVVAGMDLTGKEARHAMRQILSGGVCDPELAAFLVALRMKGENPEEIAGFVQEMRVHAVRVRSHHRVILDTCGTGGDGLGTFNISTLAALVIAGCGVAVAKHGNRSISGRCGSADLLECLGVRVDAPVSIVRRCLEKTGFAFLFAPVFHPSLRKAAAVRKVLKMRTVFNILGPLSNPAGANHQLLGIADPILAGKMAEVLKRLGCKRAYVVCGKDGMDEVSLAGETLVYRLQNGAIRRDCFKPASVGLKAASPGSLRGGGPADNAVIARKILRGAKGPQRDAVVLNAAFGLLAAGKILRLKDGLRMAEESLDAGRAREKLERLVEMTQGS